MYKEYTPSTALRNRVKSYYILDLPTPPDNPSNQVVTPDGCIELNLLLGAPLRRTDANGKITEISDPYMVSRFRQHYYMQRTGNVKLIGARFYPWAWSCFATERLSPDKLYPAKRIFPDINRLLSQIPDTDNPHACLQHFENYLLARHEEAIYPVFETTCKTIIEEHGMVNLATICYNGGITQRRLQQIFNDKIGISPKSFARMVRFQYSLKLLLDGAFKNLVDIAYMNGYCDQSHFIRDFKLFSGINPLAYLRQNTVLNDLTVQSGIR